MKKFMFAAIAAMVMVSVSNEIGRASCRERV